MQRERYLILMAAGSGTRMGVDRPKQFIDLEGKAVLHHTISRLSEALPDVKFVVVLPQDWIIWWKEYCYRCNLITPQILVAGGITRFHSVRNALEKVPEGALVGIHDGVRPFVSPALVERLFAAAMTADGAIPVTPCTDTLKVLEYRADDIDSIGTGKVLKATGETVDRSRLFGAQTPQVFKSELIKSAYRQPYDEHFTDDASVAEAQKMNLSYLPGEKFNIKLTSRDDLILAKALFSTSLL